MTAGQPENYPTVSPYLVSDDAAGVIAFAQSILNADLRLELKREDGSLMHAELQIGDSVVMLGQASPDWPQVSGYLHVYVPDAEATHDAALKAGAEEIMPPALKDGDTDLRGGFTDPFGNVWWVATHQG